jgi:hypothetical protein
VRFKKLCAGISKNIYFSTTKAYIAAEFRHINWGDNMKYSIFALLLALAASPSYAANKFNCFSTDDNEPYGLNRIELTVKSDSELSLKMDVLKVVTEKYLLDTSYEPRSTSMRGFLKFDIVDAHYDAYGEGAITPFYVEEALLSGGYPLRRGGKGAFIKTTGASYSWAKYLCVLQ